MYGHGGGGSDEGGFTLIEMLVTLVVLGILTSVAIMGIGGLVDKGHTSACNVSMDAAKAATATHFAKTNEYPQTWAAMTSTAEFQAPHSALVGTTTLQKGEWTLTMHANGPHVVTTYQCT